MFIKAIIQCKYVTIRGQLLLECNVINQVSPFITTSEHHHAIKKEIMGTEKNMWRKRERLPEEAEILKVAGFPLTTGFGDIWIPETFTA